MNAFDSFVNNGEWLDCCLKLLTERLGKFEIFQPIHHDRTH